MITITARTRLPKGCIFYYEPPTTTFTGTLVPNADHTPNDCITLDLGDRIAIIPRRDLLDSQPLPLKATSYGVPGSHGELYLVVDDGRFWSCTCRGFEFRRTCKHIIETRNQLEGLTGPVRDDGTN